MLLKPDKNRWRDVIWDSPIFNYRGQTQFGWICLKHENLVLGKYVDIAFGTILFAHCGIEIEDYVQIGPNCSIMSKSTIDNKEGKVTIKYNARIGANSVIMPGITIGKNSVVGACSFVNKDIPDNVIAYGAPCEIKRGDMK